jgi:hypothetical protein
MMACADLNNPIERAALAIQQSFDGEILSLSLFVSKMGLQVKYFLSL